jgi:hypothetical protein
MKKIRKAEVEALVEVEAGDDGIRQTAEVRKAKASKRR